MARRLRVPNPPVSALLYAAHDSGGAALVLAHGAGAPQTHPFMVRYAKGLAARGIDVLTFNFPYAESGSKRPDSNDTLESTWLAVLAFARRKLPGRALFIGGKSMGGRIASQVAARDESGELAGLVFLGYPLHPPGNPAKLRSAHLARVRAPMLFVQGTRDPFGTPAELARVTRRFTTNPTIHRVPDGDHSFAVRKSAGVPQDQVHEAALDAIVSFVLRPGPASPSRRDDEPSAHAAGEHAPRVDGSTWKRLAEHDGRAHDAVMRPRLLLATLAAAAPLGIASFTTEGCGSAAPAGVGVAVQDAAVGNDEGGLDSGSDGGIDSDAGSGSAGAIDPDAGIAAVCPDAGSFIAIDGDGPTQILRTNSSPAVFYRGVPNAPWAQAYYAQGLSISGSAELDGGASLRFDIEIRESPDAGLTVFGPGSGYSYAYYTGRDGTLFSPTSALAATMTLTQADPPGGVVAGSYTVTVVDSTQPGAARLSLSGTFSTCRLPDFTGPTPPSP
jgi:predicted alpha/beta-hydrolase family hydrolase